MINSNIKTNYFNWGNIGWKYFQQIKKKAVDENMSWSGLVFSLSIAFFIVFISAQGLNLIYQSIQMDNFNQLPNQNIYKLENYNQLNSDASSELIKKIFEHRPVYAKGQLNFT